MLGRITGDDRRRSTQALSAVGLDGFAERGLDTLSGGQLQRALFARVLLQDADLILLDEPFNAIDTRTVSDLVALIHRWHGEKRTVLVVLHDLDLVREHFPRTLLLARQARRLGRDARRCCARTIFSRRGSSTKLGRSCALVRDGSAA